MKALTASKEPSFSPRQTDVLRGISRGLSNKEIAAQLHLSLPTVKTHLSTIFDRAGTRSRTGAVVVWLRLRPRLEA